MSERRRKQDDEVNALQFQHFDIDIINPLQLEAHINASKQGEGEVLAHGAPLQPITESYIWYQKLNDVTTLQASLKCEALSPSDEKTGNWRTSILLELAYRYMNSGFMVDRVPHDTDSIYAHTTTGTHAYCVRGENSLKSSSISISSLSKAELFAALGNPQETTMNHQSDVTIGDIEDIATLWGCARELIIEKYNPQLISSGHPRESITVSEYSHQRMLTAGEHVADKVGPVEGHIDPLDKIGGLTQVRTKLKEYAEIFKDRETARALDVDVPHFLLHGPPGTGKTSLVNAFAETVGAKIDKVNADEVRSRYIAEATNKMMSRIKDAIAQDEPTIVFFDEIDVYLTKDMSSEYTNAAKTLGTYMEDVTKHYPHVLIVGATNSDPHDLIESLIRPGRFETILAPPPQNHEELAQVWQSLLSASPLTITLQDGRQVPLFEDTSNNDVSPEDVTSGRHVDFGPIYFQLAESSEGLTGADMMEILRRVRRQKFLASKATGHITQITPTEIEHAVKSYRKP